MPHRQYSKPEMRYLKGSTPLIPLKVHLENNNRPHLSPLVEGLFQFVKAAASHQRQAQVLNKQHPNVANVDLHVRHAKRISQDAIRELENAIDNGSFPQRRSSI